MHVHLEKVNLTSQRTTIEPHDFGEDWGILIGAGMAFEALYLDKF